MTDRATGGYAEFPSTHWSLVGRAGADPSEARRRALGHLIHQYLPALKTYLVRGRRVAADQADDFLQGFVAQKFLEDDLVRRADATRGRFRTFLIAALNNYCASQARAAAARRRRPAGGFAPGDVAAHDGTDARAADPSAAFDLDWAREVLSQAVERMRAQCRASARADVWGVFDARVLGPTLRESEPVPYGELVVQYGFASPSQASNVLVTGNRMFARVLKEVIGSYEQDPEGVEQEIRDLRDVLSRAAAQGRPGPGVGKRGDD
jgi:RNA polymerase sigma-70 factor (ECF subfamily)